MEKDSEVCQRKMTRSLEKGPCVIKSEENTSSDKCIRNSPETSDNNRVNLKENLLKSFVGFFCIFIYCLFQPLTSVIVKKLKYISPAQLSIVRNAANFIFSLPIVVYRFDKDCLSRKDKALLIIRSVIIGAAIYFRYETFRSLPLAEATVILSSTPAIVTIGARIFLKEECGIIQTLTVIVAMCGLFLSVRVPELFGTRQSVEFDSKYVVGLANGFGGLITNAIGFLMLRNQKNVHFGITLLYSGFIGAIESALITYSASTFTPIFCGSDIFLVTMVGILGFLAHMFFILAVQAEAVGIIAVFQCSLEIIMGTLCGIFFFDKIPDVYNLSGATVVSVSLMTLGVRKWLLTLPNESQARKKLKYLFL